MGIRNRGTNIGAFNVRKSKKSIQRHHSSFTEEGNKSFLNAKNKKNE